MNAQDDDIVVDHIDNNKLNYKIENLRFATIPQNTYNTKKCKNITLSIYKGVTKSKGSFEAKINKDYKKYHLGLYDNEIIAAIAYNIKAEELFGEFANLNIIDISKSKYNEYKKIIDEKWKKSEEKKARRTSIYKGVSLNKSNRFVVSIIKDKKVYYLSTYENEIHAAIAYNLKMEQLYGDLLKPILLNKINEEDYNKYKKIVEEKLISKGML
jgi:hypothetical protein